MYSLYYILSYLVFYLYTMFQLPKRKRIVKESEDSILQKTGRYTYAFTDSDLIWIHAASVGELVSVSELVRLLDSPVLITTVTQSSAKMFRKLGFSANVVHQFAPLDSPVYVARFLEHFHPKLAIFIDSELWPNMIMMASKRCKLINLNARISYKSYRKWRYLGSFIKKLYSKFHLIYAASNDDKRKIEELSGRNVKFIGNLKLTVAPLNVDEEVHHEFKALCSGRFVVTLATFHAHEMEIVSDLVHRVLQKLPDVLFILVPKHVDKLGSLYENLKGTNYAVRSKREHLLEDTNLYIADTIGELGLWYRLANISIVGGTFSKVEGHNIIEPAKLGSAIVIGNRYNNFKDLVEKFDAHNAIRIVSDVGELAELIVDYHQFPQKIKLLSENATLCVDGSHILGELLKVIRRA